MILRPVSDQASHTEVVNQLKKSNVVQSALLQEMKRMVKHLEFATDADVEDRDLED